MCLISSVFWQQGRLVAEIQSVVPVSPDESLHNTVNRSITIDGAAPSEVALTREARGEGDAFVVGLRKLFSPKQRDLAGAVAVLKEGAEGGCLNCEFLTLVMEGIDDR